LALVLHHMVWALVLHLLVLVWAWVWVLVLLLLELVWAWVWALVLLLLELVWAWVWALEESLKPNRDIIFSLDIVEQSLKQKQGTNTWDCTTITEHLSLRHLAW